VSLKANVLANVSGQIAAAAIALATAPIFVQRLGLEAWGLVGMLVVLSAWFNLLDVGFTPAITREVARATAHDVTPQDAGDLVRCVEWIYVPAMLAVAAAMVLVAGPLAGGWLQLRALALADATHALALMGVIIAARVFENVYRAVLTGLQQMVALNAVSTAFALLRWLGALAWVIVSGRGVVALFEWQAAVSLLSLLCFGLLARARLRPLCADARARWSVLWRARGFAGGIAASSLLAFALTQVDKVLLSRLLTLAEFGTYVLAAALADTLALLAGPLYTALVPRFAQLWAARDLTAIALLYRRSAQWLAAVLMPCAALLWLNAEAVARVWTASADLAAQIAPLVALLALGRMLNAVMHVPAALQIGCGWTSLAMRMNLAAVFLLVPAILWSVPRWGAIAAAVCWLVLNLGYLAFGTWLMHRRLLPDERARWLMTGVTAPAVVAATWVALWSWLPAFSSRAAQAGAIAMVLLGAVALLVWLLPAPRAMLGAWHRPQPM
jgi:O-antigen/teichoic acid export membrane protein